MAQGKAKTGDRAAADSRSQQELLLLSGHCDIIRRRQHNRYSPHNYHSLSTRVQKIRGNGATISCISNSMQVLKYELRSFVS